MSKGYHNLPQGKSGFPSAGTDVDQVVLVRLIFFVSVFLSVVAIGFLLHVRWKLGKMGVVERLSKSSSNLSIRNSDLRATPESSRVFWMLYLISPVNIQSLSSVIE